LYVEATERLNETVTHPVWTSAWSPNNLPEIYSVFFSPPPPPPPPPPFKYWHGLWNWATKASFHIFSNEPVTHLYILATWPQFLTLPFNKPWIKTNKYGRQFMDRFSIKYNSVEGIPGDGICLFRCLFPFLALRYSFLFRRGANRRHSAHGASDGRHLSATFCYFKSVSRRQFLKTHIFWTPTTEVDRHTGQSCLNVNECTDSYWRLVNNLRLVSMCLLPVMSLSEVTMYDLVVRIMKFRKIWLVCLLSNTCIWEQDILQRIIYTAIPRLALTPHPPPLRHLNLASIEVSEQKSPIVFTLETLDISHPR
jgi:hypothetical protein